jgi:stage II sporulation protein AA (anti-sigma F factor antagonist)
MHTAAYKVDVASDRRRRENVPGQILFYVMYMEDRRMEFKYELENGCLTIRVPKELDHHCATQLRAEADLLIDSYRVNKLVFDFAGTEFMDSSGIGVVIGRCRNMNYSGGKVVAENMNERIRKIFVVSGLHKLVQMKEGEKK